MTRLEQLSGARALIEQIAETIVIQRFSFIEIPCYPQSYPR